MKLIGILTIGEDARLYYSQDGKAFGSVRGWCRYGRDKSYQWVDVKLLRNAEKLVPMFTKHKRLSVVIGDPHIETYEKKGGNEVGTKIVGILDDFEFADRKSDDDQEERPQTRPEPSRPVKAPATGFDDMDDDLPF